jgi:predicted secreted protein
VADGYGYQSSTLYHHLNMGWDGSDDVWYNLPNIDASSIDSWSSSFNIVDSVIYNIYISGTGEIISGRVTSADTSTPIFNATVTAVKTGGGTYQTTTNAGGIYALANVPSNSTYTISVAMPGHSFADQVVSTGLSQDDVKTSGNCWGVNFASSSCVAPSAPTGVSASDGAYTDHVRVTWNSVSGATGYEVWRSTSSSSGSASKLGDYTSPFDDSSAIPGTTYYYWVKASNTCGTSDFSSSDSGYASSCAVPSVPTSVSATDGTYNDHIRVTWDLASGATGYEVWRNTSNNSGSASKLGDYTSPFDDSSVTTGTMYYYWVKAKNSCGTSGFSSSDIGYVTTNPKTVSITKCTVTAGSNVGSDKISFSGTIDATAGDFTGANVVVAVSSNDLVIPCVKTFPNTGNFKKDKFKCSASNASFVLDTKTTKFSFTAKNVSLKGLSCPLTVQIKIGDSIGTADVDESIVNGPKTLIPISLLMGVKNSLLVYKPKFTRDKNTSQITQVAVSGGFSDENVNDMGLLTNPLNITVGSQTFTIPSGNFKNTTRGKFTCSKVDTSNGIAAVTFDFNKCTFTLTIKNTNFPAAGTTNFDIAFASFSGSDVVTLPP